MIIAELLMQKLKESVKELKSPALDEKAEKKKDLLNKKEMELLKTILLNAVENNKDLKALVIAFDAQMQQLSTSSREAFLNNVQQATQDTLRGYYGNNFGNVWTEFLDKEPPYNTEFEVQHFFCTNLSAHLNKALVKCIGDDVMCVDSKKEHRPTIIFELDETSPGLEPSTRHSFETRPRPPKKLAM